MKQMIPKKRMLAIIKGDAADRVPFVQYDWMAPNNEAPDLSEWNVRSKNA